MRKAGETSEHEREKDDLTSLLLTQFSDLISAGELRPGERLPAERELALRFGTSRSSLRSAVKVLEAVGVISQRAGDGSYLNPDASKILTVPLTFLVLLDGISLVDLFEARLMIEPELAARAAESASADDFAIMRRSLEAMADETVDADIAFHVAICEATRNHTCHRMFAAIHHAFRKGMELTAQLAPPGHALEFHKAVYSAIHLRRPDEARKKMFEHLTDARNVLLKACLDKDFPPLAGK